MDKEILFDNYMINEIIPESIAYYIKLFYEQNSNQSFYNYVNSALGLFNAYDEYIEEISKKVEVLLKQKYKLNILSKTPLIFKN